MNQIDLDAVKTEIREHKQQDGRKTKPYAPEVKNFICSYAREEMAKGATLNKISNDMSISFGTLQGWLRTGAEKSEKLLSKLEKKSEPKKSAPVVQRTKRKYTFRAKNYAFRAKLVSASRIRIEIEGKKITLSDVPAETAITILRGLI